MSLTAILTEAQSIIDKKQSVERAHALLTYAVKRHKEKKPANEKEAEEREKNNEYMSPEQALFALSSLARLYGERHDHPRVYSTLSSLYQLERQLKRPGENLAVTTYNMGQAKLSLKDERGALEMFRRCLIHNSQFEPCKKPHKTLTEKLKPSLDMEKKLKGILNLIPHNCEAQGSMGEFYYDQYNIEGIKYLKQSMDTCKYEIKKNKTSNELFVQWPKQRPVNIPRFLRWQKKSIQYKLMSEKKLDESFGDYDNILEVSIITLSNRSIEWKNENVTDWLTLLIPLTMMKFETVEWRYIDPLIEIIRKLTIVQLDQQKPFSFQCQLSLTPYEALFFPFNAAEQKLLMECYGNKTLSRSLEVRPPIDARMHKIKKEKRIVFPSLPAFNPQSFNLFSKKHQLNTIETKNNNIPQEWNAVEFPRRLRIGYLLGPIDINPSIVHISQLLQHHHRDYFHITAFFHNAEASSSLYRSIASGVDTVVDLSKSTTWDCMKKIVKARLDIIIDVYGASHEGPNYYGIFGFRVAPIQLMWANVVPVTAGLPDFVDAIISDNIIMKSNEHTTIISQDGGLMLTKEGDYSEKVLKLSLPYSSYPYYPRPSAPLLPGMTVDENRLPPIINNTNNNNNNNNNDNGYEQILYDEANNNTYKKLLELRSSGSFIFGSFNRINKVTPSILTHWLNILRSVPNSQLVLYTTEASPVNSRQVDNLSKYIKSNCCNNNNNNNNNNNKECQCDLLNRIHFIWYSPLSEHLMRHLLIDLLLDATTYADSNTAPDALAMGVPILTINGDLPSNRISASLLNSVDLYNDLVTNNLHDYEKKAIQLAMDSNYYQSILQKLSTNRWNLLLNSNAFISELERGYVMIWNTIAPFIVDPIPKPPVKDQDDGKYKEEIEVEMIGDDDEEEEEEENDKKSKAGQRYKKKPLKNEL